MGSRNLRNKASFKLHRERKKALLDETVRRIRLLEQRKFKLGLIHLDNIELPNEAIESVGEDEYIFSFNNIFITRKIQKMSSDLKYKVILTFDDNYYEQLKLEEIRSKSLLHYINNKVIPRILDDLHIIKRMSELALKLIEPNEKEKKEKVIRRQQNEHHRDIKIKKRETIIEGKTNYLIKHTAEEKRKKLNDLKVSNISNFIENISSMNIVINNIGLLVVKKEKDKQEIFKKDIKEVNTNEEGYFEGCSEDMSDQSSVNPQSVKLVTPVIDSGTSYYREQEHQRLGQNTMFLDDEPGWYYDNDEDY